MTPPKRKPVVGTAARVYESIVTVLSEKPMSISELVQYVNQSLNTSFRAKQFEKALAALRREGVSVIEEPARTYRINEPPSSLRLQELLRNQIDYRFN